LRSPTAKETASWCCAGRTKRLRAAEAAVVEELAFRWGYERGGGQATTWFELRHG
jgi:hypothetical protein